MSDDVTRWRRVAGVVTVAVILVTLTLVAHQIYLGMELDPPGEQGKEAISDWAVHTYGDQLDAVQFTGNESGYAVLENGSKIRYPYKDTSLVTLGATAEVVG